jgi:hypothetical protein
MIFLRLLLIFLVCGVLYKGNSQDTLTDRSYLLEVSADTSIKPNKSVPDSSVVTRKVIHDPRKATRRSALIPGWGQAYNKEYWKIPIVYTVLGITAGTYVYNDTWYKRCRLAYDIVSSGEVDRYDEIDSRLQGLITQPATLEFYRNIFRRDRDYSVLYFLLAWGLNVVDATVFGHLKDFDVSDDLSLSIQPTFNPTNRQPVMGLVISKKSNQINLLPSW